MRTNMERAQKLAERCMVLWCVGIDHNGEFDACLMCGVGVTEDHAWDGFCERMLPRRIRARWEADGFYARKVWIELMPEGV